LEFLVKVLCAYLLGSVVGGLVVGRLTGGIDIRTLGSGNAGGTNALRTQGPAFAFFVFVIDIAKGWLAAALLPRLAIPGLAANETSGAPAVPLEWVQAACAFAAIVGHVFPVWHGFRGGKGVATLVGAYAGFVPLLLVPLAATWLALVLALGFVGFASICAALAVPVYLLIRDGLAAASPGVALTPALAFALACAVLVAFTHRANLARMRAGTEPRSRLWLFGRRSR
jgi:acyl phosphate:glycerol-3-phosphate acyltransferase